MSVSWCKSVCGRARVLACVRACVFPMLILSLSPSPLEWIMDERERERRKEGKKEGEKESYTLAVFVVNEVRDSERWTNRQTDRQTDRQEKKERRNTTFFPTLTTLEIK